MENRTENVAGVSAALKKSTKLLVKGWRRDLASEEQLLT
jgi:hypothetical protein